MSPTAALRQLTNAILSSSRAPMVSHVRRASAPANASSMNVFDRKTKRIQRNRTALREDYAMFDYIKEEIGWRVADRISDVKRKFEVAVDLGCGRGHVGKNLLQETVGLLYQCDMADLVLSQSAISPEVPTFNVVADEEFFPFKNNSLDLVISSLSLHWVNDLPSTLRQVHAALKNDGCFMGAMFGGETLHELRVSLQLAELERQGGFAAHVSPFTSAQDFGGLLTRTGYVMLTLDLDDIIVNYPNMFELLQDLKGMGENNCAWSRRPMIHRDTLKAASAIYNEKFGTKNSSGLVESIPAVFQVLYFIGWKPDPSHRVAAVRGSGEVSLKDIDKLDEVSKRISQIKDEHTKTSSHPSTHPYSHPASSSLDTDSSRTDRTIAELERAIQKARQAAALEKNEGRGDQGVSDRNTTDGLGDYKNK